MNLSVEQFRVILGTLPRKAHVGDSTTPRHLAIIRGILEDTQVKRWQDPQIEKRSDVPRPYYFIRPYVPQAGSAGLERVRKRIPLGFCDQITMRKAQSRKQEIMGPINQGKFILQAQIRFKDLVEKYREARLPTLGSATRSLYETHIDNHILPVFGEAELADIDRQSIEAWLAREAAPHLHGEHEFASLGWWTRQDLRKILSAIFTAAKDWGLWEAENPCAHVKVGQKDEGREKRIPSATDLQLFLCALPDTNVMPVLDARLMVLTAVVSGLRVSEVLGLAPGDLDPQTETGKVERRWYRGEFGPPKSSASRRVRQLGPLAPLLVELGQGRQYIFERDPERLLMIEIYNSTSFVPLPKRWGFTSRDSGCIPSGD